MVVSASQVASDWGAVILRQGGNAIDAAIATAFALAVTRPDAGSIGGGGFLVRCLSRSACSSIDYREKAPLQAHPRLYFDGDKLVPEKAREGALAAGIPGVVAGLYLAHQKYGSLRWKRLLEGPIRMAREGVPFTGHLQAMAKRRWKSFNPEMKKMLGCGDIDDVAPLGPCAPGTVLKQTDLAKVLAAIARSGEKGFYRGWVAKKLVEGVRRDGGIWTLSDLADYRAVERAPLSGTRFGMEVVSMPPPSAGGIALLQALNFVEMARSSEFSLGFASHSAIHAEAHAMMLAFSDRSHVGDPGPDSGSGLKMVEPLLRENYLRRRWESSFESGSANWVDSTGVSPRDEGPSQTTHLSVIDKNGNAVAITTTTNYFYGNGMVVPGTGVFLNNEMDDFGIAVGASNSYGLVGAQKNLVRSGRRPVSSMSPTIVRDQNGEVRLVLGALGGSRIPTSIFQVLVNRFIFGMSLPEAVSVPRIHHQWKPKKLFFEQNGFSPETLRALEKMGYEVALRKNVARVHAIERFVSGSVWGVSDPRDESGVAPE